MKQIIITGGRDYSDYNKVSKILDLIKPDFVIQGGATGADMLAKEWAIENKVEHKTVDAHWTLHGRAAGPIRNIEMIETYPFAIVVAFPGNAGTANCIKEAIKRNRTVLQIRE